MALRGLLSGRARRAASGLLAAAALATSLTVSATGTPPLTPVENGVWYEVFVRSFQDSDGDGSGDLPGLSRRLPYLAELGVTGIWLMPIHPSPSYHGYDITDYRAINPDYGTLEDFEALLVSAHALGIRVIIDLVPNHSSSQHPWFLAAAAGDPAYRDYYVWSDDPPDWRGTRGGSAWHAAPAATAGPAPEGGPAAEAGTAGPAAPAGRTAPGGHYLGLFSGAMPDLNHRNAAVVREFEEIARFWLELGVDGFRVDAIQHIVESDDGRIANTPETYAWVERFQAFVDRIAPDALVVGETWTEMPAIVRYHAESGLAMSFDYPLWRELLAALQSRSAADLSFSLAQALQLYPQDAWRGTFLGNHDQVRHATQLSLPRRDEARLKLAASLLLALPGTPFLYYGEELGMVDGPGRGDVEKRTPMPWRPGPGLGFTEGAPWTDPGPGVPGVSLAEQRASPSSLWWHYRRAISLRRLHPALDHGATAVLESGSRAVLALRRWAPGETLLVLANLSTREVEVELPELASATVELVTGEILTGRPRSGGSYRLPGLQLRILRLE